MEAGSWNDAKNATCLFRILVASFTNTLGKPSANFLQVHDKSEHDEFRVEPHVVLALALCIKGS